MFFVSLNFYIMTNGNGNTIIAKVFFLKSFFYFKRYDNRH